jgi:phage-related protein
MAFSFRPIKLPRLKLPKLKQLAIGIPVTVIGGLTLAKKLSLVGEFVNKSLSPLQSTLKKIVCLDLTATGNSIKGFINNTISSVTSLIKNQVQNLVNSALSTINGAINNVKSAVQSIISEFNSTKSQLSQQAKKLKESLKAEIDSLSSLTDCNKNTNQITAAIPKTVNSEIKKLTNKEQKEILENPEANEQFVNKVTEKSINESVKVAENIVNEPIDYKNQIAALIRLQNLA